MIYAFLAFELKSDWEDHISTQMMEKIKGNRQWDAFLAMLRKYDDHYLVQWCMQFHTYAVFEALIDDYLDYYKLFIN